MTTDLVLALSVTVVWLLGDFLLIVPAAENCRLLGTLVKERRCNIWLAAIIETFSAMPWLLWFALYGEFMAKMWRSAL